MVRHPCPWLRFDNSRWQLNLKVLSLVGRTLLDTDDLIPRIVMRVVIQPLLVPVEPHLWLGPMVMQRRGGDLAVDMLVVGKELSALLGFVPWSRVVLVRLGGVLVHFPRAWAGVDELPFVGFAGGPTVVDEVEASAAGAVFVFADTLFDFDAAF